MLRAVYQRSSLRHRRQRGAALIFALAILAVLCCFAVGMCTVLRVESRASENHLLGKRARLVAEGGVQRACAELFASELSDPTGVSGHWQVSDPGVPIERAKSFSWGAADEVGPFTGILGGTFASRGDRYLLRVFDTSAKLDLNATSDYVAVELDVLGRAIGRTQLATDPVRERGAAIVALVRERGGLRSIDELSSCIGDADTRVLADFVTVNAVRDPTTSRFALDQGGYRLRDRRGYSLVASEPRASVCVNTAPWPVLVACYCGVMGSDSIPVTLEQATTLANSLVAWRQSTEAGRGPITTWEAFARYLYGVSKSANLTPGQRDAILANANPNLAVGELIPDAVELSLGNTSALIRRTTPFSLFTSGVYEVESLGRLLDSKGEVVAESHLRAAVRIFEVARHTTQEEFATGSGENVTTMPAPIGEDPSPSVGYVQLAPTSPVAPASGAVLNFSGGRLDPFILSALPATASGSSPGSGKVPQGVAVGYWAHHAAQSAPIELMQAPMLVREHLPPSTRSVGPRGPLHRDGLRLGRDAKPVRYGLQSGGMEGRLAFWLKLGADETPGMIFAEERQLDSHFAVRSRLIAGRSAGRLSLDYERDLLAIAGTPNSAAPSPYASTRTNVSLLGLGSPREWHEVEIVWRNAVEHALSFDGSPLSPETPVPFGSPPLQVVAQPRNALVLGGELQGQPCFCEATIDAFVRDDSPVPSPSLADRYSGSQDRIVGRYRNAFERTPTMSTLGVLAWTAFRPRAWGSVSFRDDEFRLAVTLMHGGVVTRLRGDGSPVHIYRDQNDATQDQSRFQAQQQGQFQGQQQGQFQGQFGQGGGGAARGGAASPPSGGASSGGGGLAPLQPTQPALSPGQSGLSTGGSGSAPKIVLNGGAITYEFDFVYDRQALIARGVRPPPLAVTPVLEEVILTYSAGPKVLKLESDDR